MNRGELLSYRDELVQNALRAIREDNGAMDVEN